MNRFAAPVPLLLLAVGPAFAAKGFPADTLPLPPPVATPVDQPLQHQTGMVVLEGAHGERVIVRSLEPRNLVGGDRLDFAVLDADGDGYVSRQEAALDRSLQSMFGKVDANADGHLDREELAGWIL
ncbi:EF-hand domain-containing protein [Pseudoxanthomonas sp. NC8]|nr:EF-hand domain-containing protein [Pseudoxanthomonas sp. NC8]